ncbi:MAG: GNAT family N-acetyltransferase [Anaerolineaceae bacterium]|nr:GNAT family N-acetyltransferase [Anaerolineaceae bacterium]
MLTFHQAEIADIEILSDIAIRSKAWWGYDESLMEIFSASPILNSQDIKQKTVIKVCLDDEIIGWYLYTKKDQEVELLEFWMSPEYIGKGYGGKMFQHLGNQVKQEGIHSIVLEADPNAAPFYEHMGCKIIGQTWTEFQRFIPRMRCSIT